MTTAESGFSSDSRPSAFTFTDPRIGARVRRCAAAAGLLIALAGRASGESTQDSAPAPEATSTDRPREGLTWKWSWDQGVRYDVQVPFEKYWMGPDDTPLTQTPIEKRLAFVGKIGAIIQVDAAGYGETRGLEGAESGIELRRFRFGTRGDFFLLGHASYAIDLELVNTVLQSGDFYLWWSDLPVVSRLKIGNFTPAMSLESVTAARDTVFMENALPVQAFAPGRSAGIQVGGPELDHRLTWALGMSRTLETPTVGDQSKAGGRANARLTWLLEDLPLERRLTHFGVSASLLFESEDVRYRSRPESHIAPTFVDTGALRSAGKSWVSGLELARIRGPWLVMGESLIANIRGDDSATLWGGYLSLSRFLSDDTQPYDRASGCLARFEPPRPFSWSAHTYGALRAAARVSYLTLSNGPVSGGSETNFTANLTWFLNHYLSFDLEYGLAFVRERPNEGNLHYVQTRMQFDFF